MGSWAYVPCLSSLLWIGYYLDKSHHFPVEPIFFFLASVGLLVIALAISFHLAWYRFYPSFAPCYIMGLWAIMSAHFLVNSLLKAS